MNERVNRSNFEKLSYGQFQKQAGASRVLRQDNMRIIKKLVLKVSY